ncbi:cytochrome P450 [Nocardioides sp. Bht2]|uniref:cytochrome P450 n=1 Tax=Nocardioides sp. Bht2 TaxID=3392297 RepID=UPI0039B5898E
MPRLETARTYGRWLTKHAAGRALLRLRARRGELLPLLLVDDAVAADPSPTLDAIRDAGPLHRGVLLASTARHDAANAILRSEDFGVAGGHGELPMGGRRLMELLSKETPAGPLDPPSLLAIDPPDHARIRRQVSRAFTARAVARLSERVDEVADRLLDELARRSGPVDLIDDYAAWLPLAVIADVLGIEERDHARLLDLGNRAAVLLDPGLSWAVFSDAEDAVHDLHSWFDGHLEQLRRNPGDDILSSLVSSTDTDNLDHEELRTLALLLLGAGFETTVNLIGNAVALLDAHPDQRDALIADPSGWANAVEEVLRFDPPVQSTLRQAYVDTEVCGEKVAAGQGVVVILAGANRDPAVFTDPHRFDSTRANADAHLSFSSGIHFCMGSGLARLEAQVALRKLYERFPDLTVSGGGRRRSTRILRGYETLPVALAQCDLSAAISAETAR